jgi:hypothetical protein
VHGHVHWEKSSAFHAALGYVHNYAHQSGLSRASDSTTSSKNKPEVAA